MKCEKCGSDCFIDEWNGWVWTCPKCCLENRYATDKEVKYHEKEMQRFYKEMQKFYKD